MQHASESDADAVCSAVAQEKGPQGGDRPPRREYGDRPPRREGGFGGEGGGGDSLPPPPLPPHHHHHRAPAAATPTSSHFSLRPAAGCAMPRQLLSVWQMARTHTLHVWRMTKWF